jgi:hypothetical protein
MYNFKNFAMTAAHDMNAMSANEENNRLQQ